MKHVNLEPRLENKKKEIMEQFHAAEVAVPPPVAGVSARAERAKADMDTRKEMETGGATPSEPVLKQRVTETLKTIYDPEIPVNIFDLGLIYRVGIKDGFAEIDMTLTTPGCPVAQTFPGMVEAAVKQVPGISDATVSLVWEPPWTQAMLSEAARLELGLI